ncbi:carboxypeptidase-like regulatory domain-containing protein [Blastopirellula marina]|uniref:Carboxypeptidase regulatory-like domain-containing protein n=1 Tax=Blastopirellula marina TaxID=124 RepID=A0A2S8F3R0_9BACT|nr:carboxypeptidase-like regulatory domain-containing protein [Blastopirellula marina]PQO26790.1 hypothetical protein C5Y98_28875 [Blastopirellula marina]PQO41478.1 hypothetical protein C5Y93_30675 [Blastopirellula marina]PTL40996.1 carboxypeptidase regulatory-like domain-containing protein [Blastopirellula marina]
MNHASKLFCCLALVGLAVGCSGGDLKPVTGVVTMDGQPASGVKVIFVPVEGGRANSMALTDAAGRYALAYTTQHSGAKPGAYKVLVVREEPETGQEMIPSQYSSGGKTVLAAEVVDGGENVFNFDLASK